MKQSLIISKEEKNAIKQFLIKNKITQTDLSKQSQVQNSSICRYLQINTVSIIPFDIARKIYQALNNPAFSFLIDEKRNIYQPPLNENINKDIITNESDPWIKILKEELLKTIELLKQVPENNNQKKYNFIGKIIELNKQFEEDIKSNES